MSGVRVSQRPYLNPASCPPEPASVRGAAECARMTAIELAVGDGGSNGLPLAVGALGSLPSCAVIRFTEEAVLVYPGVIEEGMTDGTGNEIRGGDPGGCRSRTTRTCRFCPDDLRPECPQREPLRVWRSWERGRNRARHLLWWSGAVHGGDAGLPKPEYFFCDGVLDLRRLLAGARHVPHVRPVWQTQGGRRPGVAWLVPARLLYLQYLH